MSTNSNRAKLEYELAKWLQQLREEKGISQEALGIQIGKGQSDIAKIENGSKRITVIDMFDWIKALDIDIKRIDEILHTLYEKVNKEKKSFWEKK
ncbi:helix-turn-helix domain-containing protein [Cyclobacterium plantarum]|uniref:helix-turn-helix domain-containing protein n=1 Tax=Cyclobacterium plantarum TaxID=2716263 RepID=UPI003F72D1DB